MSLADDNNRKIISRSSLFLKMDQKIVIKRLKFNFRHEIGCRVIHKVGVTVTVLMSLFMLDDINIIYTFLNLSK